MVRGAAQSKTYDIAMTIAIRRSGRSVVKQAGWRLMPANETLDRLARGGLNRRASVQAQQQQGRPALRLCPRRCLPTTGRGGERRGRRRRQGYRKLSHGVARQDFTAGKTAARTNAVTGEDSHTIGLENST